MRLAAAGERGPLWVTADVQTGGKGRSGREWVSRPGNLFASYVHQTAAPIAAAHQLSLVAGVAVFDALAACGLTRGQGLRLKWPNDILIGRAKAGWHPGREQYAAGTARPDGSDRRRPEPGFASRDRRTRRNQPGGPGCRDRSALPPCMALDTALGAALTLWDESRGFAAVRSAWLERCGPAGERLTVQLPQGDITGAFVGLDPDGALLVEIEGGEVRRCTYGDVTIA